jgi:cell division transport system ATP-binding protein
LEIARGDFLLLSGPSGAGKTTLIRLLSLCERIEKGHILLEGLNTEKLRPSDYYLWRRKIGVIPQDLELLPERSVYHNVALGLRAIGMSMGKSKKLTLKILSRVGLSHRLREKVCHLSGGEARRTAIARALCNEPFLLLADEPLGDLDIALGTDIMRLFERINALGTAILLVTHRQDIRPSCKYTEIRMENGTLCKKL